ncbi:DNA-processing protein DprA [Cellulomonas massiliensis]|uniref:DNA-processing protein DprA n=1 Tax=Cellulomonas massiliensis TaxID=1465811 RepID=UPI0002FD5390
MEPGDEVAGLLVGAMGGLGAWRWLAGVLAGAGDPEWRAAQDDGAPQHLDGAARPDRARLGRAVRRWAGRFPTVDPRRDLELLDRCGGRLVVPGDDLWWPGLDDLGPAAPPCLWVRGDLPPEVPAVALVGARASTTYGERVAVDLASRLAALGWCTVSGGAYGVDAAAHRGALAAGGRTVVVLAGGVDRAYPAGNAHLFEAVVDAGGAVVSEVPPGAVPTRSRFLQRNRVIAAGTAATVVVEAAWRSGAISTARHAARLLRPVGAVPGPVTSVASAGCHRLLREGLAVCVTDADEVVELAAAVGGHLAPERGAGRLETDGLDEPARLVHGALRRRVGSGVDELAARAGVARAAAEVALGTLELAGLARRSGRSWVLAGTSQATSG